jgi:hypothetical protein
MANSPSIGQLLRFYVPYEIVGRGRFMCPHCHSRFALARVPEAMGSSQPAVDPP